MLDIKYRFQAAKEDPFRDRLGKFRDMLIYILNNKMRRSELDIRLKDLGLPYNKLPLLQTLGYIRKNYKMQYCIDTDPISISDNDLLIMYNKVLEQKSRSMYAGKTDKEIKCITFLRARGYSVTKRKNK